MPDDVKCHCCGAVHTDLPRAFGGPAPDPYYAVPEPERDTRCVLGEEQCEIDDEHFFVRGCLDIPIHDDPDDADAVLTYIVWTSLSPANYERTRDLWQVEGRESEPPSFGWLCTSLPGYPETLYLKTMVHFRPVGERPFVELEPTDHPLAVEQREGITAARAREIAERLLHGVGG